MMHLCKRVTNIRFIESMKDITLKEFAEHRIGEFTDAVEIVIVNWFAVAGVILGAIVANVVTWGVASINGMIVVTLCYVIGEMYKRNTTDMVCQNRLT